MTLRWIEQGPLTPWMYAYAQWLVGENGELSAEKGSYRARHPTGEVRSVKASSLAGRKVPRQHVARLEKRQDFRAYFQKLQQDAAFLAKELARQQIAANLEARAVALERASGRLKMPDGTVKYLEMDIGEVRQLTAPFVELAFPKKEQAAEQRQVIVLQIGGEARKLIEEAVAGAIEGPREAVEGEDYEVIERKQLTDGEED